MSLRYRAAARGKGKPYNPHKRIAELKKHRDRIVCVVGVLMQACEFYASRGDEPDNVARSALKECAARNVPNYPSELAAAHAKICSQRAQIKRLTGQ